MRGEGRKEGRMWWTTGKRARSQIVFFFLPIIVSVVCPTGPHPPLRLARRPNRGHIGEEGVGPPPAVHAYDVFIARGFSTSTLVNREDRYILGSFAMSNYFFCAIRYETDAGREGHSTTVGVPFIMLRM